MVAKGRQNANGSPKVEVGEIDTSAPFQSVKDAVTLFGEGAFSGEKPATKKPKAYSSEVLSTLGMLCQGIVVLSFWDLDMIIMAHSSFSSAIIPCSHSSLMIINI